MSVTEMPSQPEHRPSSLPWPQSMLDGSEMAARIYAYDWSTTPLGPMAAWPQSLRAAVGMILPNSFPMAMMWGQDDIEFYNDAFIPIAGYNHPMMLGSRCRDTWSEIWDTILEPVFRSVKETGKAVLTASQHFPVLRFGYLEEVYCLIAYSPLRGDHGTVDGLLITISETTGQVLGERRLTTLRELGARASEARAPAEACRIAAHTLAQSAADIPFALLYLLDDTASQATLVATAGIQADAPASPRLLDVAMHEALHLWPLPQAMASGTQVVDDLMDRFGPLPGGPWPESPRAALVMPMRTPTNARTVGFVIAGVSPRRALDEQYREFLHLVTAQVATAIANAQAYEQERQRAEALAALDRAKTAFFSNVSHEFRTPLTLMLGPLEEMLGHAARLAPADQEHVAMVYRNGLRLLRLVNALLDFSRLEAGRMQATYQPIDVAAFTADLASVFRSVVEKAGLTLTVHCPPLPDMVYVDRDMWEKIVLNLISNAFKFTCEGRITVSLTADEHQAVLQVADTGTGIAPEELPKVFDRFHRIKNTYSRTHEGTGIGLALVKELVELHGGTVGVESRLTQGTVFTVSIPLGRAHLPPERIRESGAPATAPTGPSPFVEEALRWLPEAHAEAGPACLLATAHAGAGVASIAGTAVMKPHIVLADDNTDMLAYVKRLLSPYYDVTAVPNGAAALAAIGQRPPDLVLTDVMMPGLDGFALVDHLRQEPKMRTVPIIMLSARAGEEASIEGLEAGADDYLVKPFSAKELLARIRSNLAMARFRREAEETLLQAQKMQVVGQLAGGVAHDFNSLLTVLIGNLTLLERHVTDEAGRRKLNAALKAAERSGSLTQHLLAFARKQHLHLVATDLNALIGGMDELMTRPLGGLISVELRLAHDLWPAEVDQNQVELALLNLVINARDAMPHGGTLTIATRNLPGLATTTNRAGGDYIGIAVSDTGMGMAPEVLARAFEPFFTTKHIGQGTGLGLSQVYGLVKQHGGTVEITTSVNQGTTVEMVLPRLAPSTRAG
jgi:signal transduction histidine kinase